MPVVITTAARTQSAMRAYAEECVKVFREEIELADCPLQTYALFLFMPEKGTMSMAQVVKLFKNMSQPSVSRNVDLLCGTSRLRAGGGWGLVERYEDHQDRRNKLLELTPKGRALRLKMHEQGMHMYKRIIGEDITSSSTQGETEDAQEKG